MIQPLFDDHDKNIRLDFTFTEPTDKSPTHAPTFNGNPDYNDINIGYGESKTSYNSKQLLFGQLGPCSPWNA
ncbi:unnamed protein product [Rhizopus microsporus]